MPDLNTEGERPLAKLANAIAFINQQNGWFDKVRPFADDIALLHTEVSEAYEAYRDGYAPGAQYYNERGIYADGPVAPDGSPNKPEGVPSELADVLIRLLDTCYRYGIDIDAVVTEKLAYNATRGYHHGGKTV